MAIATYRGEQTVAELATRLYTRLTPRQREKAEAALLRANPQLRELNQLPKGAILEVPALDGPRLRARSEALDPVDEIGDEVSAALKAFGQRLETRFEADQKSTQVALKLVKSAAFKRVIGEDPELEKSAHLAAKTLTSRSKATVARQKDFEAALKQALRGLRKGRR